ncbi:MAG TPA: PBP1A family penicillin-binding protein [Anaeromyxobacteraceae bacterium]|nr:PBP1A family penicillin-binding protein [Anaeromyxobacteraceae bacterium]
MDTPSEKSAARAPGLADRLLRPPRRLLGWWRGLGRRGQWRAVALALGGVTAAGGITVFAWTRELPAFDTLKDYRPLVSTRVYGADGGEVFAFARERRTVVPFDQIPEVMKKAVLAAEDAKFYEHEGVDYLAMGRCLAKGLLRGGVACGGSTITQQVVKTFLLQSDWRVKRKVKELVLAPRLEKNLTKDEILYLYLNQIYLGHRRYGVEEASRFYFGKSVRDLSVGEAAMLAGLVQSPERLSPAKHPDAAKARQRYVLRRMVEVGFLDPALAEAEAARPVQVVRHEEPAGLWYADAVRKLLDARYGPAVVETDGLVVDVTMSPFLQRAAEAALEAGLRQVDKRHGWRGAPQHLDPQQVQAALPLWRERLAVVKPQRGEVLVWDLGRVDPDEIDSDPDEDVGRRVRVRPLEAGEIYAALVEAVEDKGAVVDLGHARGLLRLAECAWARKWNPTAWTPPPKRMGDVVKPGDIVPVRVLPGKVSAADAARAGRALPLSLEQVPRVQGALVAIDPVTRGVRALVGGYDFALSQFNRATQARRQPGSAFKPFVWGAAVESRRYTPATLVYDTPDLYRDPWTGKEWKPQNFERDEYDGPMLLTAALAHSKNTVSAKLVDALGVDAVIGFARRAGIESELPRSLSLALGTGEVTPLELVNAYATLAAEGTYAAPVLITRVRDRDGRVLEETAPRGPPPPLEPSQAPGGNPPQVASPTVIPAASAGEPAREVPAGLSPDVAYVVLTMMRDVVAYGTGKAAGALSRPVAAKTGTAQDHRDAWFVGMTPDLVAGVWVGFDSHDPLGAHATGAGAALPAWLGFMQAAVGAKPPLDFPPPPGVEFVQVDPRSGLGSQDPEAPFSAFLAGTAPPSEAPVEAAPQSFFMDDR